MVHAVVTVLIWGVIVCAALSWWGPARQRQRQLQQGQDLARQFRGELRRRGLLQKRRRQGSNP